MATAERRAPAPPALTIRGLRTRAVRVPMRRPLGTSGGTITAAPLVLIDLETDDGVPGRAHLFAYSDLGARTIRPLLAGVFGVGPGGPGPPVAAREKAGARL